MCVCVWRRLTWSASLREERVRRCISKSCVHMQGDGGKG